MHNDDAYFLNLTAVMNDFEQPSIVQGKGRFIWSSWVSMWRVRLFSRLKVAPHLKQKIRQIIKLAVNRQISFHLHDTQDRSLMKIMNILVVIFEIRSVFVSFETDWTVERSSASIMISRKVNFQVGVILEVFRASFAVGKFNSWFGSFAVRCRNMLAKKHISWECRWTLSTLNLRSHWEVIIRIAVRTVLDQLRGVITVDFRLLLDVFLQPHRVIEACHFSPNHIRLLLQVIILLHQSEAFITNWVFMTRLKR